MPFLQSPVLIIVFLQHASYDFLSKIAGRCLYILDMATDEPFGVRQMCMKQLITLT